MSLENRERLPSFTVHRGYCLCFALVSRQKYILLSVPADINSIPVINACNLHIKTQWLPAHTATYVATCLVSVFYLLCRRPQLSQAGGQVLGTLTQLHSCSLIRHRGNRWLGRGHHLTTRLQSGKRKGEKKSKCVLLKCHWGIKHIIPPQHCFFNCLLTPERGYRPTFKGSPHGRKTIYTLLSLVPNVGWSNSVSV